VVASLSTPKSYWAALLTESAGRFVPADERVLLVRRPSVWWIIFHRWKWLVFPPAILVASHFAYRAATGSPPPLNVSVFGTKWLVSLPVVALIWALVVLEYQVLAWLSRLYVLTERRIFAVAGVIARDAGEVPLANIQHDVVTQNTWERLLNLGTVGVATAGGDGPVLRWLSVPNPDRVLSALRGAIDRMRVAPGPQQPLASVATGATDSADRRDSGSLGVGVMASNASLTLDSLVLNPPRDAMGPEPSPHVTPAAFSFVERGANRASGQEYQASPTVPPTEHISDTMAWFPVIGIAGGIGSGKSAVAAAFAALGCVVIDSDKEAKAALDRADVRAKLAQWWGPQVLIADGPDAGKVNRKVVADLVFKSPADRRRLEELIHPLIRARRADLKARAKASSAAGVVVDAPLLFEAGVDAECDLVVFVDAPRAERLSRVAQTRGWAAEELDRRQASQMPLDEKRARSNLVLVNDGSPEELSRRVSALWREIQALRPSPGSS
jgi:dephospho-CoA kinase